MKPFPVAYITLDCKMSGVIEHLLTIFRNIDRQRFTPFVVAIRERGDLADEIEALGVEVHVLDRFASKQYDPWALWNCYQLLKEREAKVVHAHFHYASRFSHPAAKFMGGVATLTSVHDIMASPLPKRNRINRFLSRITDRWIACSEAVKRDLVTYDRIPPENIEVLYYGIDSERFAPSPDKRAARKQKGLPIDGHLLGIFGRLAGNKGHKCLIRAMDEVVKRYPEATLLVAGHGKEEANFRSEVESLGLNSRVHFLGRRRDVPDLLGLLDCFILPSRHDPFPVVLLEAAAAGLPCVATDDGGNPESVVHERTGLLVPVDDPKALAEAIVTVLDDPERARRWGAAGRAKIERLHTARVMMEQIESLYERVLAAKGLAPATAEAA